MGPESLVHTDITMKNGIWNLELMTFASMEKEKTYKFMFVFTPLRLKGATGSPGRPIAVLSNWMFARIEAIMVTVDAGQTTLAACIGPAEPAPLALAPEADGESQTCQGDVASCAAVRKLQRAAGCRLAARNDISAVPWPRS